MNLIKLFPLLGLFLLLACSSSRITHSWKSEMPSRNYSKILVLAISGGTDMATRQQMEDHLAGDLQNQGYKATSSIKEYGPRAFRQLKEEEVQETLEFLQKWEKRTV